MVVLGNDPNSFFLHHIALFNDYNHFYHVTLEAKLEDPDAQQAYRDYRAEHGDSNDTRAVIARLAQLRADRAKLLGFPSYAAYTLETQGAKTTVAMSGC